MRKMLFLGAATAALFTAGTANATKMFTVSGTFIDTANNNAAGTLNGTISTNDAMSALESFSLTSSQSGRFESILYSTSTANWTMGGLPGTPLSGAAFTISSLLSGNTLTLQFPLPLTQSVTQLGSLSGESQRRNGVFFDVRSLSGTIAAVPEPATWAMMLVGFGMVAGAARYRRKSVAVTYA
jgi:hypothetical protein